MSLLIFILFSKGPGACEWITIDRKYLKKFREFVLKEHKIDIHLKEGLWYANIDMIPKDIPVKRVEQ
jgi:hypothetical protein